MVGPQDNAMTEIALALAMAFFSILVLTMVSMGSGMLAEVDAQARTETEKIDIRPAAAAAQDAQAEDVARETLFIFHADQFWDADLTPIDPASLPAPSPGDPATVLAVAPDLSLSRVAELRSAFGTRPLTVTPLDSAWGTRLQELKP